ncbi:hypothetical protein D3C76_1707080 [compost metagenome]
MVNGLVNPLGLTGRSIHRHHCRTVLFLGLVTITAPVVGRSVTGRQIDQVQLFIVGRYGPNVGRFQGELVLGLGCILALWRTDIPCPYQRTTEYIEGPHCT